MSAKKKRKKSGTAVVTALLLCLAVLTGILYFSANFDMEPDGESDTEGGIGSGEEILPPPEPTMEEMMMEQIKSMTLEQKVGQMFLIRYPLDGNGECLETYKPGGVVLFARDFENKTPEQMQAELASCQETIKAVSGVPMLTSVDEEGGTVTRISRYPQYRSERFLSPQQVYAAGGWEMVVSDTVEKCQLLSSLGVNVNLAPVCDVAADPSAYIYKRTFGGDAEAAAEYISLVVNTMNEQNTGSVLKHFPGYGGNSDTHQGFSLDSRPYSDFVSSDFLPFQAGIEAGAGSVMVSHNIVQCMDETYPASLSPEVHRVLRKELGFEGVIMTDDLSMKAIANSYGLEEAAVLAVKAGNDMLCCTDYEVQIPAVIAAAEAGELDMAQIEESVLRVMLWKHQLGLVDMNTEEERR